MPYDFTANKNLLKDVSSAKISFVFKISSSAKKILGCLFPDLCLYCGNKINGVAPQIRYLCPSCFSQIIPAGRQAPRQDRHKKKPAYDYLVCAAAYREPLIALIKLFKYHEYDYLAGFLGSLLADRITPLGLPLKEFAIVTSVPMHPARLKERGYNQAAELAKILSKKTRLPYNDLLTVKQFKQPQAQTPKQDRRANVADIFTVTADITGQSIILIDDVYTTGSTIDECSRALKAAGAKKIIAATLAKAS